ncbi:MAG: diguanylate cyclase [Pseudomonadota bacterium]
MIQQKKTDLIRQPIELLLVEDSHSVGQLVDRKLKTELNAHVTWTKTFKETLQVLDSSDSNQFFSAVLDFSLPDAMDGEIIDLVTQKKIPSIVFTSHITQKIREIVWSKKVVDYILKDTPQSLNSIVNIIKNLILNQEIKILLVDDSPFFIKAISELLKIRKYQIISASNAYDALTELDQHTDIKLAIIDFEMPEMNGHELCNKIRETHNREDLAIIGISSEGDKTMAARFIKSGANDFLVKQSFIMEEFYCRINQCVETIYLFHQIKQAAIIDYLTGLYNRRYFFDQGNKAFEKAKKEGLPMACVMLDIDHFKQVNDTHGHDTGDLVLQHLSNILKASVGESDIVVRLGGEEFCILVNDLSKETLGRRSIQDFLEKQFNALRNQIENSYIKINGGDQKINITVSMGISTNVYDSFSNMLKTADELLYHAKQYGRNQVFM